MRSLLDLVAPSRCLSCRVRAAPPWCRGCAARAARQRLDRACRRCGAGSIERHHGCWPDGSPVAATTALYRYRGIVADTVVTAKVRGATAAWVPLGLRLAGALGEHRGDVEAVTFVPTEPRRRRVRGCDHAELLARGVATGLELPLVPLLRSARGAPDQGARPLEERRRLPAHAFRAVRSAPHARLLLVDDVLTTGATAGAAAATLVAAGARPVHLAILARAGSHPLVQPAPAPPPAPGTARGW